MFNIGDKLDKANYTQGAIWCNENNAMIEIIDGEYVIVAIPEPTVEETAQEKIEELKAELGKTDYIDNKFIEAIVKNDSELLEALKVKYKDKLEERQAIRNRIDELEEIINDTI
jgi:prephenate dehydrogenase